VLACDASLVIELSLDTVGEDARAALGDQELVAPPLLWSEAPSVLHEMSFRGEISRALGERALNRFLEGKIGVAERRPKGLATAAWRLAGELGWAKTYDAEYLALASLLGCRLVTLDMRLRRGTERLGFVVTPAELADIDEVSDS
jgi:predicted nucleic acid-binding protein